MGDYRARIEWERGAAPFVDNRYSRGHRWHFDGGVTVAASSSPQVVRVPLSVEAAVDPEEAFVASLASCHMLWFLSLAAADGWCIDSYADDAVGVLGPNAAGRTAMLVVTLHPRARSSGARRPSRAEIEALHARAHGECFIAASVNCALHCEPVWDE